jgi:hypothetical protein
MKISESFQHMKFNIPLHPLLADHQISKAQVRGRSHHPKTKTPSMRVNKYEKTNRKRVYETIAHIYHQITLVPVVSTSRYGAISSAVTTPPFDAMYCPI